MVFSYAIYLRWTYFVCMLNLFDEPCLTLNVTLVWMIFDTFWGPLTSICTITNWDLTIIKIYDYEVVLPLLDIFSEYKWLLDHNWHNDKSKVSVYM